MITDTARNNRVQSLDWIRGLMALAIMLYHYLGSHNVELPIGRIGIYGVSTFFVLSGISMAIAYDGYISSIKSAGTYMLRRIFRILPLLWVAISAVLIPTLIYEMPHPSLRTILLNYACIFGFISPADTINTGAWSIGSEMVYYTLSIFLIPLYSWRKTLGNIAVVLTWGIALLYSCVLLDSNVSLNHQWPTYVNPLNNLYLYATGVCLYYNRATLSTPRLQSLVALCVLAFVFVAYPVSGDQITIVTGFPRVLFSLICIAVCWLGLNSPPAKPSRIGALLETLGTYSYSVYLLHPITYLMVGRLFKSIGIANNLTLLSVSLVSTLAASALAYKTVERPMIQLGKRFAKRIEDLGAAAKQS